MIPNESHSSGSLRNLARVALQYADAETSGPLPTAMKGLSILWADRSCRLTHKQLKPAVYITIQGAAWATFGEKRYMLKEGQMVIVAVDIAPRVAVLIASAKQQYVGLTIELDFAILQEMAEEMALSNYNETHSEYPFFVEPSRQLLECAHRAICLLDTPKAIPMLYLGIMREMCYWLLSGPGGNRVSQLMSVANEHDQKIVQAIQIIRDKLSEVVHVSDLAIAANMSQATFHRRFKAAIGETPLQYQKRLRLKKARRLMIFSNMLVEAAAIDVGYVSVSQFSREYSRMFGTSPRRDVRACKGSGIPARKLRAVDNKPLVGPSSVALSESSGGSRRS